MSTQQPTPPEPLQRDSVEADMIRQNIWNRLWRENEHFMAVLVGREGSGKSLTGIKIASVVDPSFTAERVMFDPVTFLEQLRDWKEESETQGKMVVIDEAGVGVGVRTWQDRAQVRFNQVLQIIRDENMGVLFTIPRLEELDSQTEGRLHAYLEMTSKKPGVWAKLKWLDWDPTRDGRNKIYREYHKRSIDGIQQQVSRLCISPPDEKLVEQYEERKSEFQAREYEEAIEGMEDDVEDETDVRDVAMEIADGSLADYVERHNQNNTPYINDRLIRADYDLSQNDAKAVKDLLNRQFDNEVLEDYA